MNGKQKKLAVLVPIGTLGAVIAALVGFGHVRGLKAAAAKTVAHVNEMQDRRLDTLEAALLVELPKFSDRLTSIETNVGWLVRLREGDHP